jgi:hypothetical protein
MPVDLLLPCWKESRHWCLSQASVISAGPQSCDSKLRFNIIVQCIFVLSESGTFRLSTNIIHFLYSPCVLYAHHIICLIILLRVDRYYKFCGCLHFSVALHVLFHMFLPVISDDIVCESTKVIRFLLTIVC